MNKISDTLLILAAGGSSTRFGGGSKLFALLQGIPVFAHAVRTASTVLTPGHILLSVPATQEAQFRALAAQYLADIPLKFTHGGSTRTESVLNALEAGQGTGCAYAAVHDAGRPLLTQEQLRRVIEAAHSTGAAMLCRKVTETVKRLTPDGTIGETIPRDTLRIAETPQIFPYRALLEATRRAQQSGQSFTDDAQVMEVYAPMKTEAVEHTGCNLKITYRDDLEFCERILETSGQSPAEL